MIVRELIAKFGFSVDKKGLDDAAGGMEKLKVRALAGVAALSGAAIGLTAFVDKMAEMGDRLDKSSRQLGVSATQLAAWEHAAEISGVSAQQLGAGMTGLANAVRGVQEGSKTSVEAFQKLGVSITDTDGKTKDLDQILLEAGSAIGALESSTDKAAIAQKLFSRSGKALIPLFNEGTDGIGKLRQEFLDLYGPGGLDEFAQQSAEYTDAMTRMKRVKEAIFVTIANQLLPTFTRFVDWVRKASAPLITLAKRLQLGKVALIALGAFAIKVGAMFVFAFAKTIATFLLVAAGIIVTLLVLEDLYQLFTGGKSVIAEFIDSLFGVGTTKDVILAIQFAFEAVKNAISAALGQAERFANFVSSIPGFETVAQFVGQNRAAFDTTGRQGLRPQVPGRLGGNQSMTTNVAKIEVRSDNPERAGEMVQKALEDRENRVLRRTAEAFRQPAPG